MVIKYMGICQPCNMHILLQTCFKQRYISRPIAPAVVFRPGQDHYRLICLFFSQRHLISYQHI